jgi:hypothetical protein
MTGSVGVVLTSGPEPADFFPGWPLEEEVAASVLNGLAEQAESASSAASISQRITRQA